jgi:16S rRNA processing protein RimM
VRGALKCRLVTDFPDRFRPGTQLVLGSQTHTLERATVQGGFVYLQFADLADRTTAEQFRGAEVLVRRQDAVRLPDGQFYWHQVIGLRVEIAGSGETLGTVIDILETGANDVYVVGGRRGEVLIPAIKDVVKDIDPSAGRILIEPLPGMLP